MGGKNNGVEEESMDYYQVLGVEKGCSDADLKNAYKKLALRWHPDRWSAFGNWKKVEEAKNKFQTIQEAYSVLSNANKRFLYDVGVYDTDDDADDENGMADFLSEMAVMMSQNKPAAAENGEETFAELKDLFEEMFQSDIDSLSSSSQTGSTASYSSLFSSSGESYSASNKRASSEMSSNTKPTPREPTDHFQGFCIGTGGGLSPGRGGSSRNARKGSSSSSSSSRKGHR